MRYHYVRQWNESAVAFCHEYSGGIVAASGDPCDGSLASCPDRARIDYQQRELLATALYAWTDYIDQINREHGWHDEARDFAADIALLHSEVSEALEAYRDCVIETRLIGGKPTGVASELADIFIRLLDTCSRYGVNLAAEVEAKVSYNRTRPHRHGGKLL